MTLIYLIAGTIIIAKTEDVIIGVLNSEMHSIFAYPTQYCQIVNYW